MKEIKAAQHWKLSKNTLRMYRYSFHSAV